ncbi:MAG: SCO family protein [Bacteroidota bacterium]
MNKIWISLGLIGLLFSCKHKPAKTSRVAVLPYYQEASFSPHWFNEKNVLPQGFHRLPAFALQNQKGETISEKEVAGKILVVDFFFTTCPGICPQMTHHMGLIQKEFLKDEDVLLLSHSVMPAHDQVEVLQKYAQEKGVIDHKWHLLTGSREEIYDLGRNYYFVEEDLGQKKSLDDFIHTENFVLVDGKGYLRGIYNGLNEGDIAQLIADIKTLQKNG